MKVHLKQSDLPLFKRHLRKAFPEVRSSWLTEGSARSLGFKSHAALLVATEKEAPTRDTCPQAFAEFLTEKGITVSERSYSRALARGMMEPVIASDTRLTTHGYGLPPSYGYSGPRYRKGLDQCRAEFFDDACCDQFELALLMLQRSERRKTLNKTFTTYNLKHTAESISRSFGLRTDLGNYVSNGVFIVAALYDGFDVRRASWESLSGYINISSASRSKFRNRNEAENLLGLNEPVDT